MRGSLIYRLLQTKPHNSWMLFENDGQTIFILYSRRLESYWRERPAWKHGHFGNTLMLLMNPPPAQGGFPKFSTRGGLLK
jgi:hypothetical protein